MHFHHSCKLATMVKIGFLCFSKGSSKMAPSKYTFRGFPPYYKEHQPGNYIWTNKCCASSNKVTSVKPVYLQGKCLSIFLEKHYNNTSTVCLKVITLTWDILCWRLPDSLFWYGCYIQALIVFQWFFLQPTQQASLNYFRGIYTM